MTDDDRKGHFIRGCPYPYDQCKCDQYDDATRERDASIDGSTP